jgi:hypothetical protein
MTSINTDSEILFEKYCDIRQYRFERIHPRQNDGRFPDYRVYTSYGEVIIEVKQIDRNEKDKEWDRQLLTESGAFGESVVGKRVWSAIESGKGQLKRFRDENKPTILVLYDTTYRYCLSERDIDAGMFGQPIMLISRDPAEEVIVTDGGNRKFSESRKTYISAIAVLELSREFNEPFLKIYHNIFAYILLNPSHFPDVRDIHYTKGGHPDRPAGKFGIYVGPR